MLTRATKREWVLDAVLPGRGYPDWIAVPGVRVTRPPGWTTGGGTCQAAIISPGVQPPNRIKINDKAREVQHAHPSYETGMGA